MATVAYSNVDASVGRWTQVRWSALANGDVGAPFELTSIGDRSVQVKGTFGVGGSVTVQGSLDGVDWFALTDPQGNAITKTAAALEAIAEAVRFIRPSVTAGDGTTALTVDLFALRS